MATRKKFNIKTIRIIFVFFVFVKAFPAYSQVYGCKDPSANNYNSSATVNDGGCTYNITYYTPPVVLDSISYILKESSGLQWAGNSLWSFNDRGGTPDLYRIDTAATVILQTVRLTGATNVDWEDAAFDGTYFYVGDFGNNEEGSRTDLKIYKFPFSAIPDYTANPDAAIPAEQIEIINFTYSDQPQPLVPAALDSTRFDCEAMIVTDGKVHLFTKNWIDLTSTHYVINSTSAGTYVAAPLEMLNTGYLVTSADKVPGQEIIVLLGYQNAGFGNHHMHLLSDYSDGKYFNGNKRKIDLPAASEMGQAEGITFRNDTSGYISNERFERSIGPLDILVDQKLRSFNTAGFVPSNVLALDLNDFSVKKINASDKITWHFSSPAYGLEIQHSLDGIRFNVLKTYNVSTAGTFYNKPPTGINYYRIAWKENYGAYRYSKIISVKNEEKNKISRLLLRSNGELSFILSGSQAEYFTFKLLTADGKELSKIAGRSYKSGPNKINFSTRSALNGVVLLIGYGNKQEITTLLHVTK